MPGSVGGRRGVGKLIELVKGRGLEMEELVAYVWGWSVREAFDETTRWFTDQFVWDGPSRKAIFYQYRKWAHRSSANRVGWVVTKFGHRYRGLRWHFAGDDSWPWAKVTDPFRVAAAARSLRIEWAERQLMAMTDG